MKFLSENSTANKSSRIAVSSASEVKDDNSKLTSNRIRIKDHQNQKKELLQKIIRKIAQR
jgi:hypothetical protein